MARRKSRARQEEAFFQAVSGLVMLGLGLGGYGATRSFEGAIVGVVLGFGVVFALMIVLCQQRTERLKRSGIAEIDKMEGIQFEKYLGHLFRSQGYVVEATKVAGDYGADLLLRKDGIKIAVQAKRYSQNVGIKAVQEAQASIAHYAANEAWVVTNSDYTVAAYELAESNRVRLINRETLIRMILAMNPGAVQEAEPEVQVDAFVCPKCGSGLVLRTGPMGQFYGCGSFPKCRYSKSIKAV
ncbi:restriction endonuclease [Paenibacillus sp. NFR01]|uniref:restriction endonuclease n=1 Tax=Paenibacillus sp. NFR01 TaxID=1566279 RepID=UPI0008ADD6F9|nr:restriction endonuclease [Paenibacillus sp. NFR01]SET14310.1 restriction system protein [Paenibacillus sp. NFR01]